MTQESAIANDSLFPPKPLPDGIHAFSERVHGSLCGGWHPQLDEIPLETGARGQQLRACSHYWRGGAGSQFFRVPEVRSDAYRVSANDDRRRNRENWPQPFGLRRKSGHTSFPPSTVDPPQSSGSASSGRFFARNAIHASSVNRP